MGIITFGLRFSFIFLFGKMKVPPFLERALQFVPAAVISALVFPAFFYADRTLDISFGNERLLAGMVAAVVAWYTKNMLVTIGVGMAALYLLQAIGF